MSESGAPNCALEGEDTYRGLYTYEMEHSGFFAGSGEMWWLDLGGITPMEAGVQPLNLGQVQALCVELRGFALPEREFGHGHMGAYNRLLLVSQIVDVFAPAPGSISEAEAVSNPPPNVCGRR